MNRTHIRLIRISFCIALGLFLASALPSNPLDVVFCPAADTVIEQQVWSTGSGTINSHTELSSTLYLEATKTGDLGSSHLVCTYRLEAENSDSRFHLRMQMPDSYSCTPSGHGAFVCRIRW